jgi:hypothetical protein
MEIVTLGVASCSPEDLHSRAEGVPRVGFTRGTFVSHRHGRTAQRIETGNNETKSHTCKPDVLATQFISSLGV